LRPEFLVFNRDQIGTDSNRDRGPLVSKFGLRQSPMCVIQSYIQSQNLNYYQTNIFRSLFVLKN